jgi:signal peptidase
MAKETKSKAKKVLSTIANVLVWAFVAFSIAVTVMVLSAQSDEDGVPELFGKSMITIVSDSMTPTFNRGDMIFIDKLSGANGDYEAVKQLPVGTIITFWAPDDLNGDGQLNDVNTHRIVQLLPDGFKTQGDKYDTPDLYEVHYTDVIGVAHENARLPGVGAVIGFLQSSLGFFLCIVLPLIIFFLYELYNFIKVLLEEKAKKAPVSKETEEEIKRRAIEEYLKSMQAEQNAAEQNKDQEHKDQ